VKARFSAPILTSSGAHPASYTMGTSLFSGVKQLRGGVNHPPPPPLPPKLKKKESFTLTPSPFLSDRF